MLKNSDAYFPFFNFTNIFFCARSGKNFVYYHRFRRQKLADALKLYDAISTPPPRRGRGVADAYLFTTTAILESGEYYSLVAEPARRALQLT